MLTGQKEWTLKIAPIAIFLRILDLNCPHSFEVYPNKGKAA
jgi:hypothetical protein